MFRSTPRSIGLILGRTYRGDQVVVNTRISLASVNVAAELNLP